MPEVMPEPMGRRRPSEETVPLRAGDVHDYPCPRCGFDGPHPVLGVEGEVALVECGDTLCAMEFRIDPEEET